MTRRILSITLSLTACAAALLAGTAASAGAALPANRSNETAEGYDAYVGPYAQFSVAIGQIDFDDPIDGADIDNEVAGGFGITAGYRALPWLSAEGNFTFLGGNGNVEVGGFNDEDGEFFAFTFGPKFYPLGLLEIEEIPDTIQPYAFVGIGGGEAQIDNDEKSTFAARFILGIDFWLDDQIGFFAEGGGFATDDTDIDGAGIFSLGAQFRF